MHLVPNQKPFAIYEWMIAFRYIIPNKKQMFTSVISILSLIGIMVGVWALIVVMSVMNGFRAELLNRILGINGHLIVQPAMSDSFLSYDEIVKSISAIKGVKNVLPVLEGQVLVQSKIGLSSGAIVRGLRNEEVAKMPMIANNIKAGSLAHFDDSSSIAIGTGMAKKLGLTIGSSLRILASQGDVTPFGVNPRVKTYKISAIYEIGMYEYDSAIVFMPLKEAQLFFNSEGKVQSLEVFLDNPDKIDEVKPILQNMLGDKAFIIDWRTRNQAFFTALEIERNTMFIILSLIVIVAALNIISGLVMLVKDKSHDIAILRTMGASKNVVLRIFILIGMLVGVTGTIVGAFLAIVTCLNIDHLQAFISWMFGVNVFNPQLYFLSHLPAKIETSEVVMVVLMTLSMAFLATLFPAWRAAGLDPVVALRYE